jgi:hypothetical protein
MPGLVPGIHVFIPRFAKDVDGRDKPGHDECGNGEAAGAGPAASQLNPKGSFGLLIGVCRLVAVRAE